MYTFNTISLQDDMARHVVSVEIQNVRMQRYATESKANYIPSNFN